MGLIRPATPGFLVTLIATALLAVVSFCVPYFKSVFFLKATIRINENANGFITFGTLGYCIQILDSITCSKPSAGYELDINGLVGNKLPVAIPQVVVKWLTYALLMHVVALALAAVSAVFGLLAHVREMSMTCCSTCVSGFAAAVAMLAFIFDMAVFFIAKSRINKVGSAEMGNAIWLTLAAWILLFFSGCFYGVGRCCISKRRPRGDWGNKDDRPIGGSSGGGYGGNAGYAEQMRLDAVKAEADRKAKAKMAEGGLPAFHETQPLTAVVDGDSVYTDTPFLDKHSNVNSSAAAAYGGRPAQGGYAGGGYVKAPAGTSAVDEYYNPSRTQPQSTYPPQPQHLRHQPSGYASSVYAPSTYSNVPKTTSPPPPIPSSNAYQQSSQNYADPYGAAASQPVNHAAGGTSYHTASSHRQYSTTGYDPYDQQQQQRDNTAYDPYQNSSLAAAAVGSNAPVTGYAGYGQHSQQQSYNQYDQQTHTPNPYETRNPYEQNYGSQYQQQAQQPSHSQSYGAGGYHQQDRNYTLGGDGYGGNSLPPLAEASSSSGGYGAYGQAVRNSPEPIQTTLLPVQQPSQTSPVKGPRTMPGQSHDDEAPPPTYDQGNSGVKGNWGKA